MSGMKDLLGDIPYTPTTFHGSSYVPDRDFLRLNKQARRVAEVMNNGNWITLSELSRATGDPEASVSARIRDLRKIGREVEREYVSRGLFRYRLKTRAA